jgi:hypothetical protein
VAPAARPFTARRSGFPRSWGRAAVHREALRRAFVEVQRKARRLHDDAWRARYLESVPARQILIEARDAGVDEPVPDTA